MDLYGVSNLVTMIEHAQPNWRRFLKLWIGDLETDRAKLVERISSVVPRAKQE